MIQLTNILGKNENHLVEAKSAKGGFPDSFWESYSAFANTDTFANPGGMRISKTEAIEGGVSDPRNSTILKIFSLIRFGERAGSGLNGIMHIWKTVYHTDANISDQSGEVQRTVLTLPYDGHEPDVNAMLDLYDDSEDLIFDAANDKTATNDSGGDKTYDKTAINSKVDDRTGDKKTAILAFIADNPNTKACVIADHIGLKASRTREYLTELIGEGLIEPRGANKNRTYSVTK